MGSKNKYVYLSLGESDDVRRVRERGLDASQRRQRVPPAKTPKRPHDRDVGCSSAVGPGRGKVLLPRDPELHIEDSGSRDSVDFDESEDGTYGEYDNNEATEADHEMGGCNESPPEDSDDRASPHSQSSPTTRDKKKRPALSRDRLSWNIDHPVAGGPIDPTVIPSFGGHVARDIWNGKEREPLLCRTQGNHLKVLRKWTFTSEVAENIVIDSGLLHLRECVMEHIDSNLVSAFVERWQPDTNTFHMSFGEMTIMLHDVQYILGIPVDGDVAVGMPCVGLTTEDMEKACVVDLLEDKEEKINDRSCWGHGGLLMKLLVKAAKEATDPIRQARGMFAYLLSNTLFPTKTTNKAKSCIFPLLRDTARIPMFSWGSATLALLYRELGVASRADTTQIAGCLTLLQAWIYEYFPTLAPSSLVIGRNEPYARRWNPIYIARRSKSSLQHYRRVLDDLTYDKVNWLPFGRGVENVIPRTAYCGLIQFGPIVEPYDAHRTMRQIGYVQTVPTLPPIPPVTVVRDRTARSYELKYGDNTGHYLWKLRHLVPFENEDVYLTGDGATLEYFEWFDLIAHPCIRGHRQASSTETYGRNDRRACGEALADSVADAICDIPSAEIDMRMIERLVKTVWKPMAEDYRNSRIGPRARNN